MKVLVFRIGQLGDTIVALPSMWAVRSQFKDAHIALLTDAHRKRRLVRITDLLDGAGIFDEVIGYPVERGFRRVTSSLLLLFKLKWRRFDKLVYLVPSTRTPQQISRDHLFFKTAGIKQFVGFEGFPDLPKKKPGVPLPQSPSESDLLLNRIERDGIAVEGARTCFDLRLGTREHIEVNRWLGSLSSDGQRVWIAVGPGSKMPAKQWPKDRFLTVVRDLVHRFDVWPVVFGGPEDSLVGDHLIAGWGRGYNAAGILDVRSAALALQRCALYIGNDTGTMHLAAAVNVRCVAVFSARERPGLWYPSGRQHTVLRGQIDCEGCGLHTCFERHNECLSMISSREVYAACCGILASA